MRFLSTLRGYDLSNASLLNPAGMVVPNSAATSHLVFFSSGSYTEHGSTRARPRAEPVWTLR